MDKEFIKENVDVDEQTGCWIWKHYKNPDGYGQRKVGNKTYRMHRLSYTLFVGDIPNGQHVMHKCDNPSCCNPEHLRLGTHSDNMKDMWNKGRHKRPTSGSTGSKLTEQQVRDIRSMKGQISGYKLCMDYGVGDQTIYNIWNGITWKDLP